MNYELINVLGHRTYKLFLYSIIIHEKYKLNSNFITFRISLFSQNYYFCIPMAEINYIFIVF